MKSLSLKTQKIYQKHIDELKNIDISNFEDILLHSESFSIEKKLHMYSVLLNLGNDIDKYKQQIQELNKIKNERKKKRDFTEMTENETLLIEATDRVFQDMEMKKNDLISIWEKYPLSEEKIFVGLQLFHPLRSDYRNVMISGFDKKTDNYYLDGYIHFNKLIKVKNSLIIEVDPKLRIVLDEYVKQNINFQRYLFQVSVNSCIVNSTYCKKLIISSEKIFGKKMGINYYRHLNNFGLGFRTVYKKLKSYAEKMNHSLEVHITDY
ncbi:MAG: hypothetical protein AABY22_04300 [Nanoarchaeota archaeon]